MYIYMYSFTYIYTQTYIYILYMHAYTNVCSLVFRPRRRSHSGGRTPRPWVRGRHQGPVGGGDVAPKRPGRTTDSKSRNPYVVIDFVRDTSLAFALSLAGSLSLSLYLSLSLSISLSLFSLHTYTYVSYTFLCTSRYTCIDAIHIALN